MAKIVKKIVKSGRQGNGVKNISDPGLQRADQGGGGLGQFLLWFLGALAALAAVWFLFNHNLASPNWVPGLCFVAVALGFWVKACPVIHPTPEQRVTVSPKSPEKSQPTLPLHLTLLVALCLALGGFLFYFNHLFLGALPMLVLWSLLIWRRRDVTWLEQKASSSQEWIGVCLVVGVAVLLRFPFLDKNFFGLQIDEANGWWNALAVTLNPGSPFTLVAYGTAPFLTAIFFKLFGISIISAHASTCLMSVIAAYFFYRWCRLHFGFTSSMIASLLFTVSWWNLFFSFSGIPNIFLVTFETGAVYFLDKGFRDGAKRDFALSGLFFGLSALTYWGGRFFPVISATAVVGLMLWEGRRFVQAYGRALLMTLFLFLTIVGAFLVYWYVTPSDVLWGRYKELSILNVIQRTHDIFLPVRTAYWTVVGYFCPGADVIDERFCSPGKGLLDGFSGIFCLFGLLLCTVNWKRRVVFLVAGGYALGIAANALAAQNLPACQNYINPCRSFIILPYLFFFIARGLDWFLEQTLRFKVQLYRSVGIFLLSAGLFFAIYENLWIYFYRFGNNQFNWGDLGFDHLKIAEELPKYYPKDHILLYYAYDNTPVRFLHFEKLKYTPLVALDLPLRFQVVKDVAIFFPASVLDNQREKINRLYPGAKWVALRTPWGQEFFDVVEIPRDEVVKVQKGFSLLPLIP